MGNSDNDTTNQGNTTQQSHLWKGDFGNDYVQRNAPDKEFIQARTKLWAKILDRIKGDLPKSIIEIGSNAGGNLLAIDKLINVDFFAIEPNDKARESLINSGIIDAKNVRNNLATKIDFPDGVADLAFTSVVLIHIHPDQLLQALNEIYRLSSKYIVCIEYFNDKPVTIEYRGENDALFKRDFGSYWMDNFPDLKLIDYGFAWKRATAIDNMTWWIFKK